MGAYYTHAYQKGNHILLREIRNGVRKHRKLAYRPSLFVPATSPEHQHAGWTAPSGQPLQRLQFESIYAAKDFLKQYEGVEGFSIYGLPRFAYAFLNEAYPGDIAYHLPDLRIAFLDIEVDSTGGFPDMAAADKAITAITYQVGSTLHVFGCGEFTPPSPDITYTRCENESTLLYQFLQAWTGAYPDILSGWNVAAFDMPYLYRRIQNVLGAAAANSLSPWNLITERYETAKFGKEVTYLDMAGVSTLDYLDLYKKFTFTQRESYRLGHIASVELGETKIDYQDYATLAALYERNYQKFIEYNVQDVRLVNRLEGKLKLIELAITVAYDAKVNFEDVYKQVRLWDVLVHNFLWDQRVAVPSVGGGRKTEAYAGAYVKEPQTGLHNWVVSFDVNSMYPNLIRMFNISPETILDQCYSDVTVAKLLAGEVPAVPQGAALAPNGWLFNTTKPGFLPQMMERMYAHRTQYKKAMQDAQRDLEEINQEIARRSVQ